VLLQKVYIFNPGNVHDINQYDLELYFQDSNKAKFLQIGDVVTANSNGQEYEVLTWSSYPSAFSDGGSLTTKALGTNEKPAEDLDYNSDLTTPTLIDYSSTSTYGTCSLSSLSDATKFEFNLTINLPVTAQANEVKEDDYLVDSLGRIYRISYIHPTNRFNDPIKVVDIDQLGQAPTTGNINVWSPSDRYKLSSPYGGNLSQEIINKIRNRDNQVIDDHIFKDKEKIVATATDETNAYITLTSKYAGLVGVDMKVYKNGLCLDWDDYVLNSKQLSFLNNEDFYEDDKFLIYYEKVVTTI